MALYFTSYSTWRAAPGIYLEDLFVRDEFRGRGIGTALLAALASQVRAIGGARLEWSVLKCPPPSLNAGRQRGLSNGGAGNEPSIKFYESIGAQNLGLEWQVMRVTDDTLDALAGRGPAVRWA